MIRILMLALAMMATPAFGGPFGHFKKVQCPQCCDYVRAKLDKCSCEYMAQCDCCKISWIIPKCMPVKVCPPVCAQPIPKAPSCGCEVVGEPTPAPPIQPVPEPKPEGNNTVPILQTASPCANGQCPTPSVQQRGLININRQSNSRFRWRKR